MSNHLVLSLLRNGAEYLAESIITIRRKINFASSARCVSLTFPSNLVSHVLLRGVGLLSRDEIYATRARYKS